MCLTTKTTPVFKHFEAQKWKFSGTQLHLLQGFVEIVLLEMRSFSIVALICS